MAPVTGARGLVAFRAPTPQDTLPAWQLARKAPRSGSPSRYSCARWFRDFADTSLVAVAGRDVIGFLIGYRRPDVPDTYCVLRTEVGPHHGTPALGAQLLRAAAEREIARRARFVEGAVPPGDAAGVEAYAQLARWYGAPAHKEALFPSSSFPGSDHDEILHRIGPLYGTS
ncbi:GNAT family protein [Streptomyces achromogenes]|uniref:L-2,4-diaminobutyric acid acetyltransferase n=1 Tax=Streptomyces achromogenes TaxID=67255 RepID=UPI003719CD52